MLPKYPEVVDNSVVRIVAFFVFLIGSINLFVQSQLITVFLLFGFASRFLWANRIDPIAKLTHNILCPKAGIRFVPKAGIPKRFAQGIGTICCINILVFNSLGNLTASTTIAALLVVFSALEAFLGFCAGCWIFQQLMKTGLIPEATCQACNNLKL